MIASLSAEWLKLRTVRSTWIAVGTVALALAGATALCHYAVHTYDGLSPGDQARFAVTPMTQLVTMVAEIALGVLGVLAVTPEYATGLIRTSLVVVPSRGRLLSAKAAVLVALVWPVSAAALFAAAALSRAIVGDRRIQSLSDGDAHSVGLILSQATTVAAIALIGLGLGCVLRSTVGAVVAVVGLVHLVPMLTRTLPAPWDERASSLMPAALPGQIAGVGNDDSIYGAVLSPAAAGGALVGYLLLVLGTAAVLLRRRDA
ncbi:ABC transporter permease [Streptomyces sp. NPDC059063]|uniref:ABC transporter permease n=1 Tax=unclassified Streptomyces TaxID=2593676 RepID=UPI0036952803